MDLRSYRKSLGLTQAEAASELGFRSAGHLCEIEKGRIDATPKLALRIQRWSKGQVPAAEVCKAFREDPELATVGQGAPA